MFFINTKNFKVGDIIHVNRTGRRDRKVVSVHDGYLMVERTWYPNNKPNIGPAKIYISQVMINKTKIKREVAEEERFYANQVFYSKIDEFNEILTDLINI